MEIQALPFGHRATLSGPKHSLELVSDGKVDYFHETYYGRQDEQVDLRRSQGVEDLQDPRLMKSLSSLVSDYAKTGKIARKTINQCARLLGDQWHAKVYRNSGWSEYTVGFSLGDPQRVSPQEITFSTHGNRVDMRTFLPCEKLGAGSHSVSGQCQPDGSVKNILEYLSSH